MTSNNIEMPIRNLRDNKGSYYIWGYRGHHYYYVPNNAASRRAAKKKAELQMKAAFSNGYRGK